MVKLLPPFCIGCVGCMESPAADRTYFSDVLSHARGQWLPIQSRVRCFRPAATIASDDCKRGMRAATWSDDCEQRLIATATSENRERKPRTRSNSPRAARLTAGNVGPLYIRHFFGSATEARARFALRASNGYKSLYNYRETSVRATSF